MFASGAHLAAPEATLAAVHEMLSPTTLVGCGAGGVISDAREVEDGTAVSVWAASLGDGEVLPFHATVEEIEEGSGALSGMPDLDGAAGAILLADPFTFPTDAVLRVPQRGVAAAAAARRPGVGAHRRATAPALFLGEEVVDGGAVGVRLDGVEMLPCVSQGAAPIGPELTITAADGHVILELAGRPALEKLREAIEELSDDDRELVDGGLLIGIVVDAEQARLRAGRLPRARAHRRRPGHRRGRGRRRGAARPGRAAARARRDERRPRPARGARRADGGARRPPPAGALVFACNGRGRAMFGEPDHDAETVASELGGAPAAGFFAAGEIGPVGGEYFLHGFTATVAVFAR